METAASSSSARTLADTRISRGVRAAQAGLLINVVLVVAKLVAGVVGHAYVLIADAVESSADIFSSLLVWGGLRIASLPPDDDHPFGHGKAESLASAVVSLMLLGAALAIAIVAIREIRTPHHLPRPFTLAVAAGVVLVKWLLSRRVAAIGEAVGSAAVKADAWHHRADAITSAIAIVGISTALLGSRLSGGSGWESADDWAAIVAACIVAVNGVRVLRPAIDDLMDRVPDVDLRARIAATALAVDGVMTIEHLRVRRAGLDYHADVHVQAEASMSLEDAHVLSGRVKSAIRVAEPRVAWVLVHMEPYRVPNDSASVGRAR